MNPASLPVPDPARAALPAADDIVAERMQRAATGGARGVASRMAVQLQLCHDALVEDPALRVLIVDDHPSFRATARALLESEGYDVVGEAEDGASALEAFAALRPALVLLDVQLPDMDGFEVAARIKEEGGSATIVLTSSRDGCEFGSLVESSGARGFIPKAELSGAALAAMLAA